jgi:hypothetical protein
MTVERRTPGPAYANLHRSGRSITAHSANGRGASPQQLISLYCETLVPRDAIMLIVYPGSLLVWRFAEDDTANVFLSLRSSPVAPL